MMLKDNLKNVAHLRRGVRDYLAFSNSPLSSGSRQKSRNLRCRPSGQQGGQQGRHGVHGLGLDSPSSSFRHPRGAQQVSAPCCPYGGQAHSWPLISVDTQRCDIPSCTVTQSRAPHPSSEPSDTYLPHNLQAPRHQSSTQGVGEGPRQAATMESTEGCLSWEWGRVLESSWLLIKRSFV